MKDMTQKKWFEWLNTLIALGMLIVMIISLFQLKEINVNLKDISSEKLSTKEINILIPNGTYTGSHMYFNGTCLIVTSPTSIFEMC